MPSHSHASSSQQLQQRLCLRSSPDGGGPDPSCSGWPQGLGAVCAARWRAERGVHEGAASGLHEPRASQPQGESSRAWSGPPSEAVGVVKSVRQPVGGSDPECDIEAYVAALVAGAVG